jgi:hypothetical protein
VRSATLIGGISYAGGPSTSAGGGAAGSSLEPGRVIVRDTSGRRVASQRVRHGHRFHFKVAPSRYKLTARTDHMKCRRSVRARANQTTRAGVICNIP